MRLGILWAAIAVAGAMGLQSPTLAAGTREPSAPAVSCLTDTAIAASDRSAIDTLAIAATNDLVKGDYAAFNARMIEPVDLPSLEALHALLSGGEPQAPSVTHSYLLRLNGSDSVEGLCGDPTRWDTRARVVLVDSKIQAYVVLKLPTRNHDFAVVVGLVKGSAGWLVHLVHANVAASAGLTAHDLLEMARAQERKGHTFNSHMLYISAYQLADRGPKFALLARDEFEAEAKAAAKAPELEGTGPFAWTFGKTSYLVQTVGPTGFKDDGLCLQIRLVISPWSGWDDPKRLNRALIEAFDKARPEWREVFGCIIVRGVSPGGMTPAGGDLYGTVYDREDGFLSDED